jgi:hypothetical protein
MIITKLCLPRRTFLRGLGATIALPLLDAMVPAATALAATPGRSVKRLGVVYVPNGMSMTNWTPAVEGDAFELTPILQPLAPYRDRLLVLSGLADRPAFPRPGEGAGDHARAAGTFLTGVHVKKTEGADVQAGISMDQIAAQELGRETQLPSLELALETVELLGACDGGYACAYGNTISWRGPTTPNPMENDPRAVFERLFGNTDSTDRVARLSRMQTNRSILDSVTGKVTRLQQKLHPADRTRLSEYLESIRDVERRIQKAEEQSLRDLPAVEQPAGIPAGFEAHGELMFDLLALAYQCDLTRVSTFMMGREVSGRAYPEVGVPDSHHPVSHHQNRPEMIEKLAKINVFHMQVFAHFLHKLASTPDGDGSLLDHSVILYGAGISDSNTHFHDNLPIAVLGARDAGIKGGRHLRYSQETPVTNLYLTLLERLGVNAEKLGDSTGRLALLSGV